MSYLTSSKEKLTLMVNMLLMGCSMPIWFAVALDCVLDSLCLFSTMSLVACWCRKKRKMFHKEVLCMILVRFQATTLPSALLWLPSTHYLCPIPLHENKLDRMFKHDPWCQWSKCVKLVGLVKGSNMPMWWYSSIECCCRDDVKQIRLTTR